MPTTIELSHYIKTILNTDVERVLMGELLLRGLNGDPKADDIAIILAYWRAGLTVPEPNTDDIQHVISKKNDIIDDIDVIEVYNFNRYKGFDMRLRYENGDFVRVRVKIREPKTQEEKESLDVFMDFYITLSKLISEKYNEYRKIINELNNEVESMKALLEEGCEEF